MSLRVLIHTEGLDASQLEAIAVEMGNKVGLHTAIAVESENFVKSTGAKIAAGQHRTARRLGGNPTGHLERAYQAIEGEASEAAASLLVPRASRLAAAFGPVHVEPTGGRKFLTIPVHAEAYGRRAGEFDLDFIVTGPGKTPILARKDSNGNLETMFVLVKSADIPEDPTLIPFQDLGDVARDAAEEYLDELVERNLGE